MFGCDAPHTNIEGGGGITLAKSSLEGAVVENSQNFGTKESISVCAMFNFLFEMLAGKNSLTVHNGFQALTECLKYSIQYENSNINSNFSWFKYQLSNLKHKVFHGYILPSKTKMSQWLNTPELMQ